MLNVQMHSPVTGDFNMSKYDISLSQFLSEVSREAVIIEITPSEADWAAHQGQNMRRVDPATIERYAQAMSRGKWRPGADNIVFDDNGNLINGYHRMLACASCGRSVRFFVQRGAPAAEKSVFDQGRRRNIAQTHGVPVQAEGVINMLRLLGDGGKRSKDRDKTLTVFKRLGGVGAFYATAKAPKSSPVLAAFAALECADCAASAKSREMLEQFCSVYTKDSPGSSKMRKIVKWFRTREEYFGGSTDKRVAACKGLIDGLCDILRGCNPVPKYGEERYPKVYAAAARAVA